MRTGLPALLPIFRSETQIRLLALLLLEPDRDWTLASLTQSLGASVATVHRELARAERAGLAKRDASRRPHIVRGVTDSPISAPLVQMLRRTVGLEQELRDELEHRDDIRAAAIHGSWARGEMRPDSDIDIIVVGTADHRSLRRELKEVGERHGRPIDLTVFHPEEYREKLAAANGFLSLMLDRPLVPLAGDLKREAESG